MSWSRNLAIAGALLFSSSALAGSVYVNGVKADGLRNQEFQKVNVKIDASGNVYVDAPNYTVQVVEAPPQTAPPAPTGNSGPVGKYWLITEDTQSTGHTLEITVNGTLARRIASGEPQVIMDLAPWLKPGENQITVTALPGPQPGGGPLHVYVGIGSNESGTVRMTSPSVHFVRKASDPPTGTTNQYRLSVQ